MHQHSHEDIQDISRQVCLDDSKIISQLVPTVKSYPTFVGKVPPKKPYRYRVVPGSSIADVEELEFFY